MITQEQFFDLIQTGNILSVRTALEEDASLANTHDANGQSAALVAAYYHEPLIARLLVKFGAKLNLVEACAVGIADIVRQEIEKNPDAINQFAEDGFQPLGLACFFGHEDIVRYLLQAGADVNQAAQNPTQVMPIHSAVAGRTPSVVRALIDQGAQVNARQNGGFTPLHAAAQNGDIEIATLLLNAGADATVREDSGKTAFDFAQESHHFAIMDLLKKQA
jgi:ankyrin repeat protein